MLNCGLATVGLKEVSPAWPWVREVGENQWDDATVHIRHELHQTTELDSFVPYFVGRGMHSFPITQDIKMS